jgi:FAD/FMN-containing dehydrogenase
MEAAQHIVKLGAPGQLMAVELVDRTMIELSLQNPAFAPTVRGALIGEPDAVLLVEFAGDDKSAIAPLLDQLDELMGDLGLPRCVVKMVDDSAQKNLWEVRKAGLNIMMSLRGDGKPVSFIEDCAVPVCARLGRYAACPPNSGHAPRWRRQNARHRRRSQHPGAAIQRRLQRRAWRRFVSGRVDTLAIR